MKNAERIGFLAHVSLIVGNDVVLVECAFADSGHKAFPDTGTGARSQRMRLRVPAIEVADHGNRAGVRRPHSKVGAWLARDGGHVRAQLVVNPVVRAFVKEMEVLLGQQAEVAARGRRQRGCGFLTHHSQ